MSRPELTGHASLFYNQKEARKYHSSSRMVNVQREITLRAIELLLLPSATSISGDQQDQQPQPQASFILDVGCGSGLSGQVLEEQGHVWVGCDVSRDMLQVARDRMDDTLISKNSNKNQDNNDDDDDDAMEDNNNNNHNNHDDEGSDDDEDDEDIPSSGDLMHHDMGTGLPFRDGTFDACISISALQWLCYSNSKAQSPKRRLMRFFSSLYSVLKKSARAVLQFYPETAEQAVLISECATAVGFGGGIVVDYPNSAKAKKHYLVLSCDRAMKRQLPQGLAGDGTMSAAAAAAGGGGGSSGVQVSAASYAQQQHKKKQRPIRKKKGVKTKEWIVHKKETQRKKGKNVRPDSKYTARRRPGKF